MGAARAADLTRCHLHHDSGGEFHGHSPDDGTAFVAGYVGPIAAHLDNEAAACAARRDKIVAQNPMDEKELTAWLDALAEHGLIGEWHWIPHIEPGKPAAVSYLIDGNTYTHEGAVRLVRDFESAAVCRAIDSD